VDGVVGIPDLFEWGRLAQGVNMPMGTLRKLCVVSNAGQHTARPKGAPDIDKIQGGRISDRAARFGRLAGILLEGSARRCRADPSFFMTTQLDFVH